MNDIFGVDISSIVPSGLLFFVDIEFPPLKRRAIIGSPYGTKKWNKNIA